MSLLKIVIFKGHRETGRAYEQLVKINSFLAPLYNST